MALLSKIEAACALGISIELLEYFGKHCPKTAETRLLPVSRVGDEDFYKEEDLHAYRRYLAEPWPLPAKGTRPHIPDAIKNDIRFESHLACAICNDMNHGEVAHIEAVVSTLNNSPDNLIFLCPNHHTEYDLGHRPSSNVSIEAILLAKQFKRNSRLRMLRSESNVSRVMLGLVKTLEQLEKEAKKNSSPEIITVCATEAKNAIKELRSLSNAAREMGRNDKPANDVGQLLREKAPLIFKITDNDLARKKDADIIDTAEEIVDSVDAFLPEIDEVECPHCNGLGTIGLIRDFCRYCRGAQVVSHAKAEAYDRENIDETECPHCEGSGRIGWSNDYCRYCHGACVVSRERAESYEPKDINEVECPHCNGSGKTGRAGDYCRYCHGACVVSRERARSYDRENINEVECPHCEGSGRLGRAGNDCRYCRGQCVVSRERAENYEREDIDEVECPHCSGSGTIGLAGDFCSYCRGNCVVSQRQVDEYDPEEIDEMACPHCNGSGRKGIGDDFCSVCRGSQVVKRAVSEAYVERYSGRSRY